MWGAPLRGSRGGAKAHSRSSGVVIFRVFLINSRKRTKKSDVSKFQLIKFFLEMFKALVVLLATLLAVAAFGPQATGRLLRSSLSMLKVGEVAPGMSILLRM